MSPSPWSLVSAADTDSGHALRAGADSFVTREGVCVSGCSFGSLAAEIMKSDLDVHDEVAAGFGRWRDMFERGLAAMRERRNRAVTTPGEAGGA